MVASESISEQDIVQNKINIMEQSKGESTVEIVTSTNTDENTDETSSNNEQESLSCYEGNKDEVTTPPRENSRLRRMSRRLSANLVPVKPETPLGWVAFLSTMTSMLLVHEIKLQKRLTCPPLVYTQNSPYMNKLREMLANGSKDGKSILTRNIQPSLFVGTRSVMASSASYLIHRIPKNHKTVEEPIRFREVVTIRADGAKVALDWELPTESQLSSINLRQSKSKRIAQVKNGPINAPVVVILHGINNDASFGYMKSLMRSCTNRGWIACGFNFRGCGNVHLATPRGYNAGYTGDLRHVINKIQSRLVDMDNTPIFLVGNSLGANVITKYLGEEGYSGTLPKCVKGGVSLGNPLEIHSGNLSFPWNLLLGTGVKKIFAQNWKSMYHMSGCFHFKKALKKALLSKTIGQLDDAMSPFFIRNESLYPFSTKIGFNDGVDYWHDSSSNRYIQHVTVPLLILSSQDDFLVANSALRSLSCCLSNPQVLVVKTKCGGHLGWQEAPPSGKFGIGKSWGDTAMVDFFGSVLETNAVRNKMNNNDDNAPIPALGNIVESMYNSKQLISKL